MELGKPPLVALAPRGDPALQPVQFELELGIELVRRALLLGIDRLGPGIEPAKADFRPAQIAAIEPDAAFGQAREKGAVVADDDERALEPHQILLEPVDRTEVKMVGRLVKQQHVGVLRQRADDRRSAPLAAAGGGGRTGQVDPDLVGDRGGLMGLRRALARQHPILQRDGGGHIGILLEQHDSRARNDRPRPDIGVDRAREAFEQRCLARPVAADQRQPVARPDIDIDPAEQPALALVEAEILIG